MSLGAALAGQTMNSRLPTVSVLTPWTIFAVAREEKVARIVKRVARGEKCMVVVVFVSVWFWLK